MVIPMKPDPSLEPPNLNPPESISNSHPQPLETLKEAQEVESPTKTKLNLQDSPRLTTIPNHIRQLNISKPDQDSATVISMKQIRDQTAPKNPQEEFGFRENNLQVEPMRPLMRGYCSTLTLQGRQKGLYSNGGQLDGDYCEISMANG